MAREWAQHIQKKRWFRHPWSRGKTYLHQSAYITALVVAYGRVFASGRSAYNFPKRLIRYDKVELELHNRLLELRHKVHAHSDLEKWTVRPWHADGFRTTIVGQPTHRIDEPDIELFLTMTEKLLVRISARMQEIVGRYISGPEGTPAEQLERVLEVIGQLGPGENLTLAFEPDGRIGKT